MPSRVVLLSILLLAGCSAPPNDTGSPAAPSPSPSSSSRTGGTSQPSKVAVALPPEACTREGYESFFEAFVRNPGQRASLSVDGAPLDRFDIAMRDESWVQASNPDALLDIDEARAGDAFRVIAKPVERNEDDEIVKVLGPARTYGFRYTDGCWKFATAE